MEKRTYERLNANMQARLLYGDFIYTGIISNLSENGMYVHTDIRLTLSTSFILITLQKNRVFKIPAKVIRNGSGNSHYKNGVGIKITSSPKEYLEFMKNYKELNGTSC